MLDAIIAILKEDHGMVLIRREENVFEVRGRSAPDLRSAQRRALLAAHAAELAAFDKELTTVEVAPTTHRFKSGAYAPVVVVAVSDYYDHY